MENNKAPEIRMTFSLDGKIKDIDVVSDSPEDRERGLTKLQNVLPAVELIESLLRPEPPTLGVSDVQHASSISTK
jgi:hypothetical protein